MEGFGLRKVQSEVGLSGIMKVNFISFVFLNEAPVRS